MIGIIESLSFTIPINIEPSRQAATDDSIAALRLIALRQRLRGAGHLARRAAHGAATKAP